MPERFEIYIVYKRRYINTLPFLSFKIKHHLTAYFLSNISDKNCQNRSMFVEVIAIQSSVVF